MVVVAITVFGFAAQRVVDYLMTRGSDYSATNITKKGSHCD